MPGVRSEGQVMIGCWCEESFVEKIDRARLSRTRSQFCREAIADKLRTMGYEVPERETASPDRIGKGRRRTVYPISPQRAELNETSSAAAAAGKRRVKKGKVAAGKTSGK